MKKNKKGFTLVEILAVIVVLIIISIIAINKVSQVMRTNNENATKANAVTFIKAIEENASLNRVTGNFNDGTYSVSQIINMGLKVNGTKPVDGAVLIMDGKVIYSCLEYEKFTFQGNKSSSEIVKDKCGDLSSIAGEYDYTGTEEIFTAFIDGTYKIEVWGAQGGNSHDPNVFGGYGGYSVGYIDLKKNDKLYINVGEQGQNVTSDILSTSYNGGASCRTDAASRSCGNGGGATSVALKTGQLKNLTNSASDIVIVAGGGGGASTHNSDTTTSGGSAGGYIGSSGSSNRWGFGTGGTQTAGGARATTDANAQNGSFGLGGNGALNAGAGGGGGYYGGGGGHGGSAGGGSGYIGYYNLKNKSMYCYNCISNDIESLKTISVTCTENNPTEKCAKKGNGYAKITYTTEEYNDTNKYLYSVGNEFNSVTGGWIAGAEQSNGRAEKLKDSMYIYATQQGTSESHVITANAVDITGYTKIHVIYQIVSTYSTGDYGKLQVFTNNGVWVNNVGVGIYHAVVDLPSVASTKINLRDWDVNIKILQVYLSKK